MWSLHLDFRSVFQTLYHRPPVVRNARDSVSEVTRLRTFVSVTVLCPDSAFGRFGMRGGGFDQPIIMLLDVVAEHNVGLMAEQAHRDRDRDARR